MDAAPRDVPPRRATLRWRLSIVFLSFVALFLVTAVVSGVTVRSWNDAVERRSELRVLRDDVAALRQALSDQDSGVNAYMRSGDEELLAPYRAGLLREEAALARIETRLHLAPGAAADLDEVRRVGETWRAEAAEPQIEQRREWSGDDPGLSEAASARFAAVRTALDDLAAGVTREVSDAERRASDVGGNAVTVMLVSFGATLACTALAIWLFRRWVTRPLAQVGAAARAVADGGTSPMPMFDTAEFGDVAHAIDSMQRSLSDERDRAIRAYETLEQSAVLAIQVRSELAEERAVTPKGWALASRLRPAEGYVAGDCYETGLIDQDTMYVIVIDVTGHGATAALSALKSKAQLRSALRTGLPPGEALGWLASEHHDDGTDDFVTAFVAVVAVATGECRWANAGHPPALVIDHGRVTELAHSGPLIGPFDAAWATETASIPPGASLVIYTDGLTEACGEGRSRLGEAQVHECLATAVGDAPDPDGIVATLIEMVDAFQVGASTDDVTIVAITRSMVDDEQSLAPRPAGRPGQVRAAPRSLLAG